MASYTIGRVGVVAKGAYVSSTTYQPLDMVTYEDSAYICKQTSTGNTPTASSGYWMQAARGAYDGAKAGGYTGTLTQFTADLAALQSLAAELAAM